MFRRRWISNHKDAAAEPAAPPAAAPAAARQQGGAAATTPPPASSPTTSLSSASSSTNHHQQQQQQQQPALGALGLPPAGEWPQFPVFVRLSPRPLPPPPAGPDNNTSPSPPEPPQPAPQQRRRDGAPQGAPVPFNALQRVPFETELFEGEIVLNMAGLEPAPPAWKDTHGRGYFTGCAEGRTLECAVQGRFKRRLRLDEVYTGQAFTTPLLRLPPRFMVRAVEAVVRRLAPATQLDVTGDRPFIIGPLATVAAVMRVSDPSSGEATPDIMTLCEDTAALGGAFTPSPPPPPPAPVRKRRSGSFGSMGSSGSGSGSGSGGGWFGRRMTAGAWAGGGDEGNNKGAQSLPLHRDRMARRKFFADGAKLRAFHFEPGLVYGFGFFGSAWRVDAWQLSVAGLASIDLATYVHPTQALQIMARLKDRDELVWALEVWNAKALLSPDALALAAAEHRRARATQQEKQGEQGQQEGGGDQAALAAAVEGMTLEEEQQPQQEDEQQQEAEEQEQEKGKTPMQRLAGLFSPSPRKGSR